MAFESLRITGSLLGTASWVVSASKADNLIVTQFNPFAGTGSITGSMNINLAPVTADDFMFGVFQGSTNISAGTDLTFTSTVVSSGSLLTVAGTQITLAANSTYLIKWNCGASKSWGAVTGTATIQAVNASNAVIGTQATGAYLMAYPNANPLSSPIPFGICLQTTTTPQILKFRATSATTTFQLHNQANSFTIEKIL